jgi:S1-C subfamily serine protease
LKNRLSLGLLLIGLLLAASSNPSGAAQGTPVEPTLYSRAKLSVAHLGRAGFQGEQAAIQWLGTAFLVDDRCTLATAKHAIEGVPEGQLVVRFQDASGTSARTQSVRLFAQSEELDLAFLKFGPADSPKRYCGADRWQPLVVAEKIAGPELTGRPIQILGYPAIEGAPPRDLPVVRAGLVASAELEWREKPMLLLDLTGVPGFSGGPVILADTLEVIGVVYGPGRTDRVFDFEWATPLTVESLEQAIDSK